MVENNKPVQTDGIKKRIKGAIRNYRRNSAFIKEETKTDEAVLTVMGKNKASRNFILNNIRYSLSSPQKETFLKSESTDLITKLKIYEVPTDFKEKYIQDFELLVQETDCFIINVSQDVYSTDNFKNIITRLKRFRKSINTPVIFVTNTGNNGNKINLSDLLSEKQLHKFVDYAIIDIAKCFENLSEFVMNKIYEYLEKEMYGNVDNYASLDFSTNSLGKERKVAGKFMTTHKIIL